MIFTYKNKLFDIEGISQEDHIFKTIVRTQSFYEIDLLKYMHAFFMRSRNNTLAVDVGANIGNHSIFFRSFLFDHLIAIEPNTKILPILRRNLSKNIKSYSIYDCAVGESEGTGTMVMPEGANNIGMAKVAFDVNGDTIQISTIDFIVGKWQEAQKENSDVNVSLIKIDVEGMELAVLKGARQTIRKYKPHIFAEAATNDEYQILNNYLRELGYRKLSRWAATPVYHFAYKPSLLLVLRVKCIKFYRAMQRFKKRLIRHFCSEIPAKTMKVTN